jgi:hypothetical protein
VGSSVLHFIVGPKEQEQTFSIHKNLLTLHSGYHRNYFQKRNSEDDNADEVYRHPEIQPEIFAYFYTWLYGGNPSTIFGSALATLKPGGPTVAETLWIFADKWRVPGLQNYAMDAIRHGFKIDDEIDAEQVKATYSQSSKDSYLPRKLTADMIRVRSPEVDFGPRDTVC